ncbi:hypothetical protein D3C87_1272640 [compost metagenome]
MQDVIEAERHRFFARVRPFTQQVEVLQLQFAVRGGQVCVGVLLHDGGIHHLASLAQSLQSGGILAPLEGFGGRLEQVLVPRLPAAGQDMRHVGLKQEAGVHVEQAVIFQRGIQQRCRVVDRAGRVLGKSLGKRCDHRVCALVG